MNDRGEMRDAEIANCIDRNYGKGMDNHGQRTMIKINANTKEGEEVANVGDSINYSVPTSKTRRERVGHGVAQTIDTAVNQGVVVTTLHGKDASNTVRSGGRSSTSKKHSWDLIISDYRIRRFTETECEKLQGFLPNHTKFGIYDNQVKEISRTQRYKMIGNAVTVDVVELIIKKLVESDIFLPKII